VKTQILALDLSLVRSGVCRPDGTTTCIASKGLSGAARLSAIVDEVRGFCRDDDVELVVLEGYSFGSKGRAVFDIGELGGCVRLLLHRLGVPFVDVAPSSLKKYATGKGNCGKDEMIAAAIRRFGFEGSDNNEADAYLLWCMARDAYGEPVASVPQVNAAALEKVVWPGLATLESVAAGA
jgi:Holliday junction resolvasome RuvABC endonuclease subunit